MPDAQAHPAGAFQLHPHRLGIGHRDWRMLVDVVMGLLSTGKLVNDAGDVSLPLSAVTADVRSGITSGAFYKHIASKAEAFRESVALGVGEFRVAVELFQQEYGDGWLDEFAKFYLREKRCSELGESCGFQSLTPEVTRSNAATRSVFQAELEKAVASFADGLSKDGPPDASRAWATIAMLIGGVTLARAVQDLDLADEIAAAIHQAASSDTRTN